MKDYSLISLISPVLRLRGILALVGILSAGCTSIPQHQLQAYRQAFAETRTQSEHVLADYAAARLVSSNLEAQVRVQKNPDLADRSLSERLDIAVFDATGAGVPDDIEVRLKAWEVIGAYNEALAAVAAGAKPADIEGAVNGFVGALKNFPIAEVADLAGKGVPYVGAALKILELVQREVEARRFRNAVLQAEEPMKQFVALLRKDAVLLRKFRVALLDLRFTEQENEILGHVDRFRTVTAAQGWNPTNDVGALIAEINAHRLLAAGVETFPAISNAATAPAAPADQETKLVELQTLSDAVEREAAEARATVSELSAYHELMRRYVRLIAEFERTLAALTDAAKNKSRRLPTVAELQQVISSVRIAHEIYRETK